MPEIFLTHASKDDDLASQREAWRTSEGFDDLFVDSLAPLRLMLRRVHRRLVGWSAKRNHDVEPLSGVVTE